MYLSFICLFCSWMVVNIWRRLPQHVTFSNSYSQSNMQFTNLQKKPDSFWTKNNEYKEFYRTATSQRSCLRSTQLTTKTNVSLDGCILIDSVNAVCSWKGIYILLFDFLSGTPAKNNIWVIPYPSTTSVWLRNGSRQTIYTSKRMGTWIAWYWIHLLLTQCL